MALFEQLHPHYQDNAKLIAVDKRGRQQLKQMAHERQEQARRKAQGWRRDWGADFAGLNLDMAGNSPILIELGQFNVIWKAYKVINPI